MNEFFVDASIQWVELYNKGQTAIDISGWLIDDNGGTQKFTIPSNTLINASEFKVFDSGLFNFNKTTPDEARLINGSIAEDSYSYSTGPGTNKSYGRSVDGSGSWVVFEISTKGSTNNTSTSTSIPTPTPTSTPAPVTSSVPTTQSPSPSSTTSPSEEAVLAVFEEKKTFSPIPTSLFFEFGKIATKESVLGSESADFNSTPFEKSQVKTLGESENLIQKAFIILGVLFIITSLVIFARQWIKQYFQKV